MNIARSYCCFSSLRCLFMHSSCSRHCISVWLRSVNLLVCLEVLFCCMICFKANSCQTDGLIFDFRKPWNTEVFLVKSMIARCPGLLDSRHVKIINVPPLHLKVDIRCFFLIYCVSFSPNVVLCIMAKNFTFVYSKDIVPKVLYWFIQMLLCKP